MVYYSVNSPTPFMDDYKEQEEKALVNGIFFVIISLWLIICCGLAIEICND